MACVRVGPHLYAVRQRERRTRIHVQTAASISVLQTGPGPILHSPPFRPATRDKRLPHHGVTRRGLSCQSRQLGRTHRVERAALRRKSAVLELAAAGREQFQPGARPDGRGQEAARWLEQ